MSEDLLTTIEELRNEVEGLQDVINRWKKDEELDYKIAREEVELLRASGVAWYPGEPTVVAIKRLIEERNELLDILHTIKEYIDEYRQLSLPDKLQVADETARMIEQKVDELNEHSS